MRDRLYRPVRPRVIVLVLALSIAAILGGVARVVGASEVVAFALFFVLFVAVGVFVALTGHSPGESPP
jgi:hypothetical protein